MTLINTPQKKMDVVVSLAKGETQESIAERHDVCRQTIGKISKKEEDKVLEVRSRIFNENIDVMADNIKDSIELSHDLTKEFKEDEKSITPARVTLKLGIDKTVANPLLSRVGIHNSPVINQLNIDNSTNVHQHVDPTVLRMIGAGFGLDIEEMEMNKVIEAEVLEVE